jgi:sodium-dependent dicarboxylate transporter 2/3/5
MTDNDLVRTGSAAPSKLRKTVGFYLGIAASGLILLWPTPEGMPPAAKRMAAAVVLAGCWWIGESLPLGVTALVPLVAFPLLKIQPITEVAPNYANHYVFLLLGGFFIALTMQRWHLHTRIALWIIRLVGTSAARLVLGFMLASAFLSMWISNSATAMMMMPIGLGLIVKTEDMQSGETKQSITRFGACLMLGIAYASNIGGVATLIGTFPNLVFAGMFKKLFPGGPEITFFEWLKIGLPFTVIFVPLIWLYMVKGALPIRGKVVEKADQVIAAEVQKLGNMGRGEKMTLAIFIITALLWIFRSDIHVGGFVIRGWASLLGVAGYVQDSTVAIGMGILCFILPVDMKRGIPLLDWAQARKAPWGILLLFGGGFAIANGFEASGLTQWVGTQLTVLRNVPVFLVIAAVVFTMTFLTEMTSNTASTTMMLPIMAATAQALRINPLLLMLPATISASSAFMLPIGTPPNAIVFSSGRVSMAQMGKTGFLLNLITVVFVTAFVYLVVTRLMGISPQQAPVWLK